jgi:hypothetical protein
MSRRHFVVRTNTTNRGGIHAPFHSRNARVTWMVVYESDGSEVVELPTLRGDQSISDWCVERGLEVETNCLVEILR